MKYMISMGWMLAALAGCSTQDYPGDKRFQLSGLVSFEGDAVDLGSITLTPAGGEAKSVSGGVIQDGKYDIPEVKGPNAGTYRVEMHWLKRTGKQLLDDTTGEMYDQRIEALPAKFHTRTEMTIEIPAADNKYDFELKK